MLAVAVAWSALALPAQRAALARAGDGERPELTLKATPLVAFTPAQIRLAVEVKGGQDDYEAFYCADIEWDWGDETRSELRSDCEPYEQGKSEIKRRYMVTHTYRIGGQYRIVFRLKRGDNVVGSATTTVQIRSGLRDLGSPW